MSLGPTKDSELPGRPDILGEGNGQQEGGCGGDASGDTESQAGERCAGCQLKSSPKSLL